MDIAPFFAGAMHNEFVFETLLFFKNKPCYYKVFRSTNGFYGEPTPHHYYITTPFPHFLVVENNDSLKVEGVHDHQMVQQILSELNHHLQKAKEI